MSYGYISQTDALFNQLNAINNSFSPSYNNNSMESIMYLTAMSNTYGSGCDYNTNNSRSYSTMSRSTNYSVGQWTSEGVF